MKKMCWKNALALAVTCAVVGMPHVGMASQKDIYVRSDGVSNGARVTYRYKDDSLFRVNTKLGFVNDIELRPGETVTHIAGGDTKRWMIDKAVIGNVQHVYIKPIEPGIDTNIIINTNQRAYRLYVVASDKYDPLISFSFPDSSPAERLRVPEDDVLPVGDRTNRNYEIRVNKKADKSLIPLEIFDDGRQTFIRMSKDNKYDLPVLYNIDPWNKKNISMVNYRVKGDYFVADGVFPHGRLFYQQKFWIDFYNLDRKATVKGTFPANGSSSSRRVRVVELEDDEEPDAVMQERREREQRAAAERRREEAALKKEEQRKAAEALKAEEARCKAEAALRMEEDRRRQAEALRQAEEQRKAQAALQKEQERQARERERLIQKQKAEEQARLIARQQEEARLREEARKQQLAREEALRKQRIAEQQEAARREKLAREEAARQEKLAREEAARREKFVREEEALRERFIREQAALREKYGRGQQPRNEAAVRQQAARQEAMRRQQAAQQEALRRQQLARQEALRRQQLARQEAERQQALQQEAMRQDIGEAQDYEDARRQKQAEEQMARDAAVSQYANSQQARVAAVTKPESGVGRQELSRQQVYDDMYRVYRQGQDRKAGERG